MATQLTDQAPRRRRVLPWVAAGAAVAIAGTTWGVSVLMARASTEALNTAVYCGEPATLGNAPSSMVVVDPDNAPADLLPLPRRIALAKDLCAEYWSNEGTRFNPAIVSVLQQRDGFLVALTGPLDEGHAAGLGLTTPAF